MLKRHEVEILLKAGHPQTEVARLAGVSLCSVKRIAEEAPVCAPKIVQKAASGNLVLLTSLDTTKLPVT
jgi:DNA invertase Pin-like site-specific DNA recombinase